MLNNKKVAAIICEFNPFHNGHKYHIEQTKKQTGAEYVMCIMSGSMVQRGEIAITDKWQRAKTAVQNGADLVVELPAYYVLQSAENFAAGGVGVAHKSGIADCLSFGSETGDVLLLKSLADVLVSPPSVFTDTLKKQLGSGAGYPAAMEAAFCAAGFEKKLNPNDTLAINYIKAIKQLGSAISPVAVVRTNSYHGIEVNSNMASATAVRELMSNEGDISAFVPDVPKDVYDGAALENVILGFFRIASKNALADIIGMEEGLAERLICCAKQSTSLYEFINSATTKRYTAHRIKRVVMCSLLGIKKGYECDYIRVLASNQKGFEMISAIKEKSPLEVITKTADFVPKANSTFPFDVGATDIAALCSTYPEKRVASKDYLNSPEIIK